MSQTNIAYLNPSHIIPIRGLNLRVASIVEGFMAGLHQSPFHGFSNEFREYRPYQQGESTRHIDWRQYAKTDRSLTRLYTDETNLRATIILDQSASMGFCSSKGMDKFTYAQTLAASLAWILIRQRDAVGLAFYDLDVVQHIAPRSTNLQLKTLLKALEHAQPRSKTDCGAAINRVAATLDKRGLCIVVSDLFDEPLSILQGLRHLRFKRQSVIVLWVLDPLEHSFSANRDMRMRDIESGEEIVVDSVTAQHFFSAGIAAHQKKLQETCKELRIDFIPVVTTDPFARTLHRVCERRGKLG